MEIGRAKTLANLLDRPDLTPLASSTPVYENREEHLETGGMEDSAAKTGIDPVSCSSPEMTEMNPLDSPEIRRSQKADHPVISFRGKGPTLSPDYEMAQSESTGADFGQDLPEVEDGHQSRGIAFAFQTSLQRQPHAVYPVAYVQHVSTSSQQKAMAFDGFDGANANVSGEHSDAIRGRRNSVHPLEQIERSMPHKLTLQFWQDEERLLRAQIQTHSSSCSRIEQEINQIVGFDFLFQGILVASTAQASVLDCLTAWVPLILSIAASLTTFFAIFRKLETLDMLNSQLLSEQSDAGVLFEYMEKMKSLGELFDLSDLPHVSSHTKTREEKFGTTTSKVLNAIWSYKFFVLLALLVFSILVVVSFKKLLCNS